MNGDKEKEKEKMDNEDDEKKAANNEGARREKDQHIQLKNYI